LHLYNTGFKYWESGEEIQKRREINQKYTRPNLTQELIMTLYKLPSEDPDLMRFENTAFYSCSDITREITMYFGSNNKDISAMKVGKELTKLNLHTKRANGCTRYLLIKKDDFERKKDQMVERKEVKEDAKIEDEDMELPF
ncbi:MAG: hypothetical protein H6Q15_1949, partial [Bacteroidetes bacterium]|nr:hypothetical protein [Bacteroidota bacterium]